MQQPLTSSAADAGARPSVFMRSLTLMKPITWFGPMWAFLCGAIASGAASWSFPDISRILLGMLLGGPLLCGMSQVINDYFDREVDAVNEPYRLIPSGMVSMRQIAITVAVLLSGGVAASLVLGPLVAFASAVGLALAILYSAPPFRAKRNGWVGNLLVAISYEGLAWIAGHLAFGALTPASVLIALLYSLGAHGIMSVNDYKSIKGDRASGINTIPVLHGEKLAAWLVVITMLGAQLGVVIAFWLWGGWLVSVLVLGLMALQLQTGRKFLAQPEDNFLSFSVNGSMFFVWGMMISAIGLNILKP
jgi:chlorophyll synthase